MKNLLHFSLKEKEFTANPSKGIFEVLKFTVCTKVLRKVWL